MRKNGLLEIIAAHRTVADLDELLKVDKSYQEALTEEQVTSEIMDSLNLTSEQKKVVDRVITANNEWGAADGAVAYRFGMEGGMRGRTMAGVRMPYSMMLSVISDMASSSRTLKGWFGKGCSSDSGI